MSIIQEAKTPGEGGKVAEHAFAGTSDDLDVDLDSEVDVSGDIMPSF
jgi:serine/threonine-protein kinase SRK2